jgi:hypothetical protein
LGGPSPAWLHGKPYPKAFSSFPDYRRAEKLTEHNLNQNEAAIEAWTPYDSSPTPPFTVMASMPSTS